MNGGQMRPASRARRKLAWIARKLVSVLRTKRTTVRILAAAPHRSRQIADLGERMTVIMSYRVASERRAEMLRIGVQHLARSLVSVDVPIQVIDASPADWQTATRAIWQDSGLAPNLTFEDASLVRSYARLLERTDTPYCLVQFDDVLTVGLGPGFLAAAADLLERYSGLVSVVRPAWAHNVRLRDPEATIELTVDWSGRPVRRRSYHLRAGVRQRPSRIEVIRGHAFGLFENTGYGFVFNTLVAPTRDFGRRLRWYAEHVSADSPQRIELAAADRTVGPYWSHIAVCLTGTVVTLDFDAEHTPSSVRADTADPALLRALSAGYEIKVVGRERPSEAAD
jgi:hypothetical protein